VAKKNPVMRRRLSTVVRKAIMSYYTQKEAQAIAAAAKKLNVSMSSFVANAALREADVVIRARKAIR
jgi:uncharacterized protein (DUF1778 family)